MITTLVQFRVPASMTCTQVQADFSYIAPMFRSVTGLIRKYFLLSEQGDIAGDVCLWKSREDAERFYNSGFAELIAQRYGSQPSIVYFDSPVIVDNLTGGMIVTEECRM